MKYALRSVDDDDHVFLVELHNDPEVLKNLTHPEPITLEQHTTWWESIRRKDTQLRLIFTVDDVPAGFAKFYDIDRTNKNCVLGADIHKDSRGKGYARPMWTLMIEHCFNVLGMHRISLTTAEYNAIGRRVYVKLGFKEEGRYVESLLRDDVYHDQILMYMLRSDWQNRHEEHITHR